jgi:hypothetical protein
MLALSGSRHAQNMLLPQQAMRRDKVEVLANIFLIRNNQTIQPKRSRTTDKKVRFFSG